MISDKKLYELMIRHHSTFVGWLIHKGIVGIGENKLFLVDNSNQENIARIPNENDYTVYETFDDGVKRINSDRNKNFCEIQLNYKIRDVSFKKLVDAGFPIFKLAYTSEYFCFTHQIENILNLYPDLVLDIYIPENFKRLKGKSIENFMRFLQNQIDYIISNNNEFKGYFHFNYSIIGGDSPYWEKPPKKIVNINKHGLFANIDIYKYVEWNFEMVEKYKDQIMWLYLINESNLIWTEEMLVKYDSYIPFCTNDTSTYCARFKYDIDYTKFGPLSNNYINAHKEVLNWLHFFKNCKFQWNDTELTYFCNYALSINDPYSDSFPDSPVSSQIQYHIPDLLSNSYFKWDSKNLLAFLLLKEKYWECLVSSFLPEIYKVFLSIENIKEIAEPYVSKIENFWEIVSNQHPYPYDKLSKEFTIKQIKCNKQEWTKVLENDFLWMRRTPDTNYSTYLAVTQWDIFVSKINIPLSYELANYLSKINIILGGTYIESDGGYLENDYRRPQYNGLQAFALHHIDCPNDIEKILKDDSLTNILLDYRNSVNIDLVSYITQLFFKDYSINNYIDLINQMKNWNIVKERFYGEYNLDLTKSSRREDKMLYSFFLESLGEQIELD